VHIIQQAAWNSTPKPQTSHRRHLHTYDQTENPRQETVKKAGAKSRSPQDKAKLNKVATELKQLLLDHKQQAIQTYLENLTATEATDYSLWKTTKRLQRPQTPIPSLRTARGEWAKTGTQKAQVLAEHFTTVFKAYDSELSRAEEQELLHTTDAPKRQNNPVKKSKISEVKAMINRLRPTKATGYDLITGRILKELPDIGIKAITYIYNNIL